MAVTIKAKEGFDHDNPYQVGQSGLIGNPGAPSAFNGCDLVLMLGTDFPGPSSTSGSSGTPEARPGCSRTA